MTIETTPDGTLVSDLFRKPSVGNIILRDNSFHVQSLLHSIPYSQYLRLQRNCSDDIKFKVAAGNLKDHILTREDIPSHACLRHTIGLSFNPIIIYYLTTKLNPMTILAKL